MCVLKSNMALSEYFNWVFDKDPSDCCVGSVGLLWNQIFEVGCKSQSKYKSEACSKSCGHSNQTFPQEFPDFFGQKKLTANFTQSSDKDTSLFGAPRIKKQH